MSHVHVLFCVDVFLFLFYRACVSHLLFPQQAVTNSRSSFSFRAMQNRPGSVAAHTSFDGSRHHLENACGPMDDKGSNINCSGALQDGTGTSSHAALALPPHLVDAPKEYVARQSMLAQRLRVWRTSHRKGIENKRE